MGIDQKRGYGKLWWQNPHSITMYPGCGAIGTGFSKCTSFHRQWACSHSSSKRQIVASSFVHNGKRPGDPCILQQLGSPWATAPDGERGRPAFSSAEPAPCMLEFVILYFSLPKFFDPDQKRKKLIHYEYLAKNFRLYRRRRRKTFLSLYRRRRRFFFFSNLRIYELRIGKKSFFIVRKYLRTTNREKSFFIVRKRTAQ